MKNNHRNYEKMIILAAHDGVSLNSMVEKAMKAYIRDIT